MRLFKYTLLSLLAVTMVACLDDDTEYEYSDDAKVVSLKFKKNDSIPHLETAFFVIDNDSNVIYNIDSLPFQTRIDSVFPTFSFASSSGAILYVGEDTIYLTGSDTVDFTKQPIVLQNFPANQDKDKMKEYKITVNVHQVEPELFVWKRMSESAYTHEAASQKLIWINDMLHLYVSSGVNSYLYTSTDGATWTPQTLTGLMGNDQFNTMLELNGVLYISNIDGLYASTDTRAWTKLTTNVATLSNLLFVLDGALHGLVVDASGNQRFANSTDGTTWNIGTITPADFPVEGYAAVTYRTKTTKEKAFVIGGLSADNEVLNTRWSTENGTYWTNFTVEEPEFGSMANTSIVQYDDKLYMFGGVDQDNVVLENSILLSNDEGMSWQAPDTTYNQLPETYIKRYKQTVAVDNNHHIIIVGGQDRTEFFQDVWRGKLNRLGFDEE